MVHRNFIGFLIKRGNKFKIEKWYFAVCSLIKKQKKLNKFSDYFFQVFYRLSPVLFFNKKLVGGILYKIPATVSLKKRLSLTFISFKRNLLILKSKNIKSEYFLLIFNELIDIEKGLGLTYKWRKDIDNLLTLNSPLVRFLRQLRQVIQIKY